MCLRIVGNPAYCERVIDSLNILVRLQDGANMPHPYREDRLPSDQNRKTKHQQVCWGKFLLLSFPQCFPCISLPLLLPDISAADYNLI